MSTLPGDADRAQAAGPAHRPGARRHLPGRQGRAGLREPVPAPRRDRPVGADDRQAGQRGEPGALRALPGRRAARRRRPRRARADHPADRASSGPRPSRCSSCRTPWSSGSTARFPARLEDLVTLPGVGRKTANVVLGNAFGVPGITVDTHFGRLARRFGWTGETDPVKVEHEVGALFEKRDWTMLSHHLIWHGRRICHARNPACGACPVARWCPAYGEGPTDPAQGGQAGAHRGARMSVARRLRRAAVVLAGCHRCCCAACSGAPSAVMSPSQGAPTAHVTVDSPELAALAGEGGSRSVRGREGRPGAGRSAVADAALPRRR